MILGVGFNHVFLWEGRLPVKLLSLIVCLAALCSKPSVDVLFSANFKSCASLDPLEGHCCMVNT